MKRWSRAEAATQGRAADRTHFTGDVTQLVVDEVSEPQTVRIYVVGFKDGARTHWHRHLGGQTLHVVEGKGRTQVRGGEVANLEPGDVVTVGPDEEHWHGAQESQDMTHVAISLGTTEWGAAPD